MSDKVILGVCLVILPSEKLTKDLSRSMNLTGQAFNKSSGRKFRKTPDSVLAPRNMHLPYTRQREVGLKYTSIILIIKIIVSNKKKLIFISLL